MSTILQRFDRNSHGRDFVVGDIHGCFDALRREMDRVDFVPATDRLFSVGDLIDRGPQSMEALDWLAEPWFHACIGNHEEMALESLNDESVLLGWVLLNGGEWWAALDSDTRLRYASAFQRLPVAMEIATAHGRVGIVHADVPEGLTWQAFVDALEAGNVGAREVALWSRWRADGLVRAPVEGIDHVVCGHTITPDFRIHVYENVWFIDTGAFATEEGGHLTLLSLYSLFEDTGSITVNPNDAP